MKKKPYEAHEGLYRKMRDRGLRCWEELNGQNQYIDGIDIHLKRFMADALAMPWAPKAGKAIELGCGTGPILRWVAGRGFRGVGIDISRTAIAMAREQSRGTGLRFVKGNVCDVDRNMAGRFDVAIDGHCLHCLTSPADRKAFLRSAFQVLRPGGLLLVSTMCRPLDREEFRHQRQGRIVGPVLYAPFEGASEYEGSRLIKGRMHLPTRYIGHWKGIIGEIRAAGFRTQLIRLSLHTTGHVMSDLCVGALA